MWGGRSCPSQFFVISPIAGQAVRQDQSQTQRAVTDNGQTVPEKAAQDPRFQFFDELPEGSYEAFLSVPLMCQGRVVGVHTSCAEPKQRRLSFRKEQRGQGICRAANEAGKSSFAEAAYRAGCEVISLCRKRAGVSNSKNLC